MPVQVLTSISRNYFTLTNGITAAEFFPTKCLPGNCLWGRCMCGRFYGETKNYIIKNINETLRQKPFKKLHRSSSQAINFHVMEGFTASCNSKLFENCLPALLELNAHFAFERWFSKNFCSNCRTRKIPQAILCFS